MSKDTGSARKGRRIAVTAAGVGALIGAPLAAWAPR